MKHVLVSGIILSCVVAVDVESSLAQPPVPSIQLPQPPAINIQLPQVRRKANTRNVQQMPTNRRQAAIGDAYRMRSPANGPQSRIVRPGFSNWRLGVNTNDAPLGLRIVNVENWSPGYYAGLEPDDYILDVNGYPVGAYANGYFPLQAAFTQLAGPDGWVELAVWNHRTRQEEYMWVQLTSR